MIKTMDSWFFMRPGFGTFRLEPDKHRQFLFGSQERKQRDFLLGELEGASYSTEGHKAVIFGDYGLGKTHMCQNLIYEVGQRQMSLLPLYIKCSAYTSKEPFQSLFREMVLQLPTDDVSRVATEYVRQSQRGAAPTLTDVVQSEDIAFVMTKGLAAVDRDAVRNCMRWLGGEAKVPMGLISHALKPQLTDSREFGAVMRGLVHIFEVIDKRVPLYLVDEAERFENVSNVDTFANWLAALRELTEIVGVGLMFFIGAKTRNNLPTLVVQDEVVRRIGAANYIEFRNPSREGVRDFLIELLSTMIRKGSAPTPHRAALGSASADEAVAPELDQLTGGDATRLETFPFEPDAFDEFIVQISTSDLTNKPSEVLIRLQKAAQRAMRQNQRTINAKIVDAISAEGF